MREVRRNLSGGLFGRGRAARRFARCALAALALAGWTSAASADDAAKGEIIAKRWCAACHVVSADQVKGNSDAPTFASIARKKQPKKLKAFLTDPHPKMPDMNFTRSEIADIVAYIGSLER